MNADGAWGGGREAPGPAVLAYVGDAVFGLLVRTLALDRLMAEPGAPAPSLAALHRVVEPLLAAEGQARLLSLIWPDLEPDERDVVRRARNARVRHRPRGTGYATYRRSTGLEALMGYLYLEGRTERLVGLIRRGLERSGGGGPAERG